MLARSLWTAFALMLSVAPAGCSDNPHQVASASPMDASASPVDASALPADASASPADVSAEASAPLSLFAAGATQASVMAAVPGFATQSGLTINFTFGNAGSLRDQILTGTSGADVAIVTPAVVTALDAKSFVYAGSRVDLAQVAAGLAVRSDDGLPDISDSDKFKATLLAADEIYYADPVLSTAGAAFINICTTLGIADTCAAAPNGKGHTAAEGAGAMAAMALSTATTVVGAAQISEIKATTGVKLVAQYPAAPINLQVTTVYSAIIVEGTRNLADAQLLLQFLASDAFMTQLAAYGFEPVSDP
jgi:molybdate transport system substrate-binding protein